MLEAVSGYTLGDIFDGHKQYTVPPHQRGYAWEQDQISEFLEDLVSANDYGPAHEHFFGFILTVSDPKKSDHPIEIIDGQQRISTSMLFLICARDFFHGVNSPNSQEYGTELEGKIQSLEYETKPILTLGRANKDLFKEIVLGTPVKRSILDALAKSDTNVNLADAYKQILSWLRGKEPEDVHSYIKALFTKFTIIRYDYPDEQKAYEVFNLINNRGIRLNESDHIKNYLFGELERAEGGNAIDEYDEVWASMRETVTSKKDVGYKNFDTFLHHCMLASNAYSSTSPKLDNMHRAFSHLIHNKNKKPARQILDDLLEWSKILKTLRNPDLYTEFARNPTTKYYLKKIKLIKAVYVYPPILIAYKRYWKRGREDLFQLVVMLCFKYHMRAKVIFKLSTGDYERQMYKITEAIFKDRDGSKLLPTIIDLTEQDTYPPSDSIFVNLESIPIKGYQNIIALLQEVEYHKTQKHNSEAVTLEHIMPKDRKKWEDYIYNNNKNHLDSKKTRDENIKVIHTRYLNYLGNQTLLSRSNNNNARNDTFQKKKEDYEQHPKYKITEELVDIDIWNVDQILKRTNELARLLCTELDLARFTEYLHKDYGDGVKPDDVL